MIKKIVLISLILFASLPAMAQQREKEEIITPVVQLEKRQYQTRTYQAEDKALVMKAILNTLQDNGFIIYNANYLLGFIYGSKDFDTGNSETDISKEFGLSKSRLNLNGIKVATIETTTNVTEFDKSLRVRINFKRKLLNTYGNAQFIDDIQEEEFYTQFFEQLDKALFLLKQKV